MYNTCKFLYKIVELKRPDLEQSMNVKLYLRGHQVSIRGRRDVLERVVDEINGLQERLKGLISKADKSEILKG